MEVQYLINGRYLQLRILKWPLTGESKWPSPIFRSRKARCFEALRKHQASNSTPDGSEVGGGLADRLGISIFVWLKMLVRMDIHKFSGLWLEHDFLFSIYWEFHHPN